MRCLDYGKGFDDFDASVWGDSVLGYEPVDCEFGDELFGGFFVCEGDQTTDRLGILSDGDSATESLFGDLDIRVYWSGFEASCLVVF